MTDREKLDFAEFKIDFHISKCGRCDVCNLWIPLEESHIAHRIPKTKSNLKKYGKGIIHHPLNLALTCPDCNSAVLINNDPVSKGLLIAKIERALIEDEVRLNIKRKVGKI